jgi:hypothetical protein
LKYNRKRRILEAKIGGVKPPLTRLNFKVLTILGKSISRKSKLLKQLTTDANNMGMLVLTYSNYGSVSAQNIVSYAQNDFIFNQDIESLDNTLLIYDSSITGNKLKAMKSVAKRTNAIVIYFGNESEQEIPKDEMLKKSAMIQFLNKNKVKIQDNTHEKIVKSLNLGALTIKSVSIGILILGVGFVLGGAYNLRQTPLVGKGDYSLTANETMKSGVLYSTPDGVGIGIMNSIKSNASDSAISSAIKNISTKPNVGVLTLQANYYKTSQGLRAIVDFGLTAKNEVDSAMKSSKLQDTTWKSYVNRKLSYVVINTTAYKTEDEEKADESKAKTALDSGDLTALSNNENVSAVSDVLTTSSQFTQLPLYTDASSMEKIKNGKTGSIVEIDVSNFKVLLKLESDDIAKKTDKGYQAYLKQLASTQVGNELASQVDSNTNIDANSRIAIENDIKTALNQYGARG